VTQPITKILMQDTSTGELALCVGDEWSEGYPDDAMQFMYEEGNYSCDCNRHLFFNRALGRPEPETECSLRENRFHVLAFEVERGSERYELAGNWQSGAVQGSK